MAVFWMGCGHPVGVHPLDAHEVHRSLTSNVLTTGELSARSRQLLERTANQELFDSDPSVVLSTFHARLARADGLRRKFLLFPMAELSFFHAQETGRKDHYLAAAVYAYAWLFGQAEGTVSDVLDPHLRLAADLYNQAIVAVFRDEPGSPTVFEPGEYPLPFGSLDIELVEESFERDDYVYDDFRPAAELGVTGFRNRFRRAGIGAPLAARLSRKEALPEGEVEYLSAIIRIPVTVFLWIDEPVDALSKSRLQGRIELFSSAESDRIDVDGRDVKLEYETTSSIAYGLADDQVWNFEISGFFSSGGTEDFQPLMMLSPYQSGRVPLVLVHGTASSPGRWADLVNELYSEVWFRKNFQIWVFRYDTGNPIAYSAGILREELERAVSKLDPEGVDDALQHMIVVGHSQGGLLTKMTAIDSGDVFWENMSPETFAEARLSDETRRLLERSLFYTPLPFVERLIFIATPHRGSYRATGRIGRFASRLVKVSLVIPEAAAEIANSSDESRAIDRLGRVSTSVENMDPRNQFLNTLLGIPIAPDVSAHSIIAVRGEGPVEKGNDGVVEYSSAHLDEAESEIVVRSGHSVQSHPRTVGEVYRILRLHLGERFDVPYQR